MKKLSLFLLSVTLIILPRASFAETLTLSTYYPAPFGVYDRIRLVPMDVAAYPTCTINVNDGLLWVDEISYELMMCQGGSWAPAPSIWKQNATTDAYITNTASKAGIGTMAPDRRLDVRGSSVEIMRLDSGSGTGVELLFSEVGADRGSIGASSTEAFYVKDNAGTKNFILEQDGDVIFGSAAADPAVYMNVDGNIISRGISAYTTSTGSSRRISLVYNSVTDRGMIEGFDSSTLSPIDITMQNSGGNVGIGTNLAPAARLDVNGDGRYRGDLVVSTTGDATGTGTVNAHVFLYISDEKTKENIKPVRGLDAIMQLQGVEFTRTGNGKKGIGLVAQDVEKVFPELVDTISQSELKGVQYGNLVAPLIEAVKEQQAQINALKEEIEILKNRQF